MSLNANATYSGKVRNMAGFLSEIDASDAKLVHLEAGSISSGNILTNNRYFQKGTIQGFAASGFASLAAASQLTLLSVPGLRNATGAGDSRLVLLPAKALVSNVYVNNNGTAITSAAITGFLTIGPGAIALTPTAASPDVALMSTVPYVNVNTGSATGHTAAPVSESPNNYLNVQATTATINAGDLHVIVDYVVFQN